MAYVTGESWTDGLQVEERSLQEYLFKKEQSLFLKGAAEVLKHTLEPTPTFCSDEEAVHLGDSLMLRSLGTQGLLQADVNDHVPVLDGSKSELEGGTLSTGRMFLACPRTVFTISRAKDNDGFGDSMALHYGQTVRLGASLQLAERPHYLYASSQGSDGLAAPETLACLYGRAAPGTLWRVVAPTGEAARTGPVPQREALALESAATGQRLRSDASIRMNSYGNESRVYAAPPGHGDASQECWTFVSSQWAADVVETTRRHATWPLAEGTAPRALGAPDGGDQLSTDFGLLLQDPGALAEHELRALETEGPGANYGVLARVFPLLRNAGMHVTRKTRRMCVRADVDGRGELACSTFQGILSWVGLRLKEGESQMLLNLFGVSPENEDLSYHKFFALMGSNMAEVRRSTTRDAYEKLVRMSRSGQVEVIHMQRSWNPRCHPEVHAGRLSEDEAREDFLGQWDVASADGLVSWDEFLDYYRDVSLAVDKDEVFVEIVRSAWRLEAAA